MTETASSETRLRLQLGRWEPILVTMILLVAVVIRLGFHAADWQFPIHDGGLFYVMTQELIENSYRLPAVTSYNDLGIPYAYPPFSFYLAGLTSQLFDVPLLLVFKYLPMTFNVLTILVFYFLARDTFTREIALLAAFVYAIVPRAMQWLIAGGGLTRSVGMFFGVLTLWLAYRLYHHRERRALIGVVLAASITITAHIDTAWFIALTALLMFLFFGRTRRAFIESVVAAVLITLLVSPWWGTVIYHHGFEPFVNAFGTRNESAVAKVFLVAGAFTGETILSVVGVLGLLGMLYLVAMKQFFIPAWAYVIWVFSGRSSATQSMLPISLAVAFFLIGVLLPKIRVEPPTPRLISKSVSILAWTLVVIIGILLSLSVVVSPRTPDPLNIALHTVDEQQRNAMAWIQANTGPAARFLVITDEIHGSEDAISEWFPALTRRVSVATVQGSEWLPVEDQERLAFLHGSTQLCGTLDPACLTVLQEEVGLQFDHIFVAPGPNAFSAALQARPEYRLVYDAGPFVFAVDGAP